MSFVLRALQAVCPPDHVYKIALYPEDVEIDAYTSEGEWVGFGYDVGGKQLDGYRIEMDGDEAVLRFYGAEWLNADIKAKCALIYDVDTGDAVNLMVFPRVTGVIGGIYEVKMPDEGVVRLGGVA